MARRSRNQWNRLHGLQRGIHTADQFVQFPAVSEFQPVAVAAIRIDVGRQDDVAVPGAMAATEFEAVEWPFEQVFDRNTGIAGNRDEGGIGAVFKQPAHEIGEQVARSHRPGRKIRQGTGRLPSVTA